MIVYENRNQLGCEDASRAFSEFLSSEPDATTIDRVSYLFGLQAYCRNQLKKELTAAMDALETGEGQPLEVGATRTMSRAPD